MVLIFGGVYQGKLDYALQRFGLSEDDVAFCLETDADTPAGKRIIYEVDKWVLALLRAGFDVEHSVKQLLTDNRGVIVICNDISCGVVPMDPVLRRWREEVGRLMGVLTQCSDEVIRLYCGIPSKLK